MAERRAALKEICQKFNVAILYVFGSRADEVYGWLDGAIAELTPGPSDVDAGVKAMPGVQWSFHDKVLLSIALEDLLGCSRVDVVALDTANPFLADEIVRGNRLYARDEYEADEYDLYVLRRAGDLAPLEREWMSQILEISDEELYGICARELGDVERIADAYRRWLKQHPEQWSQDADSLTR